jgi:hypothetical protein
MPDAILLQNTPIITTCACQLGDFQAIVRRFIRRHRLLLAQDLPASDPRLPTIAYEPDSDIHVPTQAQLQGSGQRWVALFRGAEPFLRPMRLCSFALPPTGRATGGLSHCRFNDGPSAGVSCYP